ncbi:hypothetical protein C2S51_017518 [Perilla frutescens var. frutescens]|nr:hypothetical protein C2S51_017518 [Perilla frutescens var. frutescens]
MSAKGLFPSEESDDDEVPIQISGLGGQENQNNETLCLVGKVWTHKSFNVFSLFDVMKKLWNPVYGVTCREIEPNLFSFQFKNKKDMEKVIMMEPWTFNKHILVLKKASVDIQPSRMVLNSVPFWVRIYDLPLAGRNPGMVQQIGNRIGKFVELDTSTISGMNRSVRIKILFNLDQPLKRGTKIQLDRDKPLWLPVKYERLQSYCYWCGMLGHNVADCEKTEGVDINVAGKEDFFKYGEWLRASPIKLAKVVIDQGFRDATSSRKKIDFPQQMGTTADKTTEIKCTNAATNQRVDEIVSTLERVAMSKPVVLGSMMSNSDKRKGERRQKDPLEMESRPKHTLHHHPMPHFPKPSSKPPITLPNQPIISLPNKPNSSLPSSKVNPSTSNVKTFESIFTADITPLSDLLRLTQKPMQETNFREYKSTTPHMEPYNKNLLNLTPNIPENPKPSSTKKLKTWSRLNKNKSLEGPEYKPSEQKKRNVTIFEDNKRFYGWPEQKYKENTWYLLKEIKPTQRMAWMCLGDFNTIMWYSEKCRGNSKSWIEMNMFRDTLLQCHLIDLGYCVNQFTWSNGRGGDDNVLERLDRALANRDWQRLYPHYNIKHLPRYKSDHNPILLDCAEEGGDDITGRWRKRRFRFEHMWLHHPQFAKNLENMWKNGAENQTYSEKVKACGERLMAWDQTEFGSVKHKIRDLQQQLSNIQAQPQSISNVQNSKRIESELDRVLKMEESMWYQRSKALWLKEGDRNSRFFHQKANQRQKRNNIRRLKNENGDWIYKKKEIEQQLSEYFCELFSSDGDREINAVVNALETKVSAEMNKGLMKHFTAGEVHKAVQQMHPSKAPGPDASHGSQPSYLWRSLLASRNLVATGTGWRVGNGLQIRIRDDVWIGLENPTKTSGLDRENHELQLVSDLIDETTIQWKEEEIRTMFCQEEATKVLTIPLSARLPLDRRIWTPSKNGRFTVKSAYHLAVSSFSQISPRRASSSNNPTEWKHLWKIKVLPRVRVFLWQACMESLPTKKNLFKRDLLEDPICILCVEETETFNHLMLKGPVAAKTWYWSPLRIDTYKAPFSTFKELLWNYLNNTNPELGELIAYTAWAIWNGRNKAIFDNKKFSHQNIMEEARRNSKKERKKAPRIERRAGRLIAGNPRRKGY